MIKLDSGPMSQPDLLLHERQELIRKRLAAEGRIIAAALAQELGISEDTIRRDLREMAASGLCRRVYGGALPPIPIESSLSERLAVGPERKQRLAEAAISLLQPGMTVFLDAGSTNLAIAQAIPAEMRLHIITNAPVIAAALIEHQAFDIVLIGGQIDKRAGGAIGAKAISDARIFHPDIFFLGTCGLEPETGVTATLFEEAEFKRFIAGQSRVVVVAATNEKLGAPAPYGIIGLDRCSHIILEHDASPDFASRIAGHGSEIIRAGAPNRQFAADMAGRGYLQEKTS
jgi:DeoR/GlpR family transcriptional regulator of sugar metabolism